MWSVYPSLAYCMRHAKVRGAKLPRCKCYCFPHEHRPLEWRDCIFPSPEVRPRPTISNDEWHARMRERIQPWTPYEALDEEDRARLDARLAIMMRGRGGAK